MNSLKKYLRNILNNKVFSVITIGSFAVSLSVIIILCAFLVSEYSYDDHIKDIDRIYRLKASKNEASIPEQASGLLMNRIPEIEAATNFIISSEPVVYEGQSYNADVINSDEGLFTVLPIEFLRGNPQGIFEDKSHVVISEGLAHRIFGNKDPVGQTLNISHKEDVVIQAVIRDFPDKSTLSGDLICSTALRIRYSRSCYNDNCTYFYKSLIKLHGRSSVGDINSKLAGVIPKINEKDKNIYSLLPFRNVYFDTSLSRDSLKHSNNKLLKLLAWLTIVMLLLAVFNYINLSLAQNTSRFKEFGVKKAVGAGAKDIYHQFFREAFFTTIIASILAVELADLIKPLFISLLGKDFRIMDLFSTPLLIFISLLSLCTIAVISAFYPARLASKGLAKDLLQKRMAGKEGAFSLRKSLNILQFTVAIAIIVALIVITRQIEYVKTKDLGFNTEYLIRIPVHNKASVKAGLLINEINAISGVKKSCFSMGIPGEVITYNDNDDNGKVYMITSDQSFTETFQLSLIQGRNFFPDEGKNVCLINKKAMTQAGWDDFVGKSIFGYEVIGLIEDFHYQDLYNEIGALMIANGKDVTHFTVRLLPGDIGGTLEKIKSVFKKILPDYEYSFSFYDEFFDSMYKQEEKRAQTILIISVISIFLSCIGLMGLVEFSTRRRIKEIGIRKINGAGISEIVFLLNWDFIRWIFIGFIIATPIAWYCLDSWLRSFAYRSDLSWWIFLLAGIVVLVISLFTVSWQSWRAATRNPVEALRYE
jgi:putative ABC transport system permease protein